MIRPLSLKVGDKIAIVSPAGAIRDHSIVEKAAQTLRSWGLEPVISPRTLSRNGYYAGSRQERTEEMLNAIVDDSIKAILCSYGGFGCIHLIEDVAKAIKESPKWIIGMSDCCVLHAACSAAGIESLHASQCRHLAEFPTSEHVANIRRILFGDLPQYQLKPHPLNITGHREGVISGGNMSVLCSLLRTPYDIFRPGNILFIEDINEPIYRIERMLQNLKLAGILQQSQALIIGVFTDTKEHTAFGGTLYEIIHRIVSDCNIPVCFNFPVGHGAVNMPVIEGAKAIIEITEERGTTLKFL